jgi:hypothetical protein
MTPIPQKVVDAIVNDDLSTFLTSDLCHDWDTCRDLIVKYASKNIFDHFVVDHKVIRRFDDVQSGNWKPILDILKRMEVPCRLQQSWW